MSVVIQGMKMPKNCAECPCEHYECLLLDKDAEDIMQYFTGDERHPDCPLIDLPPHGRLIDADALITTFCEWGTRLERGRKLVITMCEAKQAIVDIIEDATTIIPAEEGE